ncbi:juvenile hormone esterase-like [Epargyreus clarus]|uniref:juvenile hormone esterase-like n=1 Tax=Epargyreus clarus TaxID=520877 RepID=UPI003C3095B2
MALSTRGYEFVFKQLFILYHFYDIVSTSHVTNIIHFQSYPTTKGTMPTVTISQGTLIGSKAYTQRGTPYFEFLGIPYARPPLGVLRFKSPQPPETWEGVRDARTVNNSQVCFQTDLFTNEVIGSEDCLYLNVYTPKLPNNKEEFKLPVMLSLHGGGFLHGNGVIKGETGPDFLIDNDVVVVSINYRLGILGFLSMDIPEAAGNMGLKDQAQALQWLQDNIHKFGGDKNNVTIFGVSAGSASVELHILSPKSKGLFHKAILQSGSSLNHWVINYEPQKLLNKVLEKLGYEGTVESKRSIYKYLLNCPPEVLVEESSKVVGESEPERLFFGYVPTIEKGFGNNEAFLTTKPYKLLKEGNFNRVPVIKGFCEKEGYLMELSKPSVIEELNKDENFVKHWAYNLTKIDRKIYNTKFSKAYGENEGVDFFSDYDFISVILLSAQIMANYGVPVYVYRFAYDGKMNFFKNAFNFTKPGAAHADDVTYIITNEISKLADESDKIVRDKMTKMWTHFAKTGNPVPCSSNLAWPRYDKCSQVYLNIDKEFTMESHYQTSRMEIFQEIYHKYQK